MIDTAKVEQEWHGRNSATKVAAAFLTSESYVRRIWRTAQDEGRLPAGIRPAFQKFTRRDDPAEGDDPLIDLPDDCVVPIGSDDRLLAALIREHGGDPRRRFDTVLISDAALSHSPARVEAVAAAAANIAQKFREGRL